jgi:hypothetical protein
LNLNYVAGIQWTGQLGREILPDGSPGRFARFSSLLFGLRAGAKNLLAYYQVHGLDTVRKVIGRFAPPQDGNDTDAYVTFVAGVVGVGPDDSVDLTDPGVLALFLRATSRKENGKDPSSRWWSDQMLSDDLLKQAVALALA